MIRLPEFSYYSPKTLRETLKILASERGKARAVAGGTDLFPNMKRRVQTPAVLVSLNQVKELHRNISRRRSAGIVIPSGSTLSEVSRNQLIQQFYPSLSKTASSIATPLIQNMGTIGGNLCLDTRCTYYNQSPEWRESVGYCMKAPEGKPDIPCRVAPGSPQCVAVNSSDTAPLFCALQGEFTLVSSDGERKIKACDFYRNDGELYLNLKPDEILSEMILPLPENLKVCYLKLRRRGSFDFPVLGVAAALKIANQKVEEARIFLNAVSSAPIEAAESEKILIGSSLEDGKLKKETIAKSARQAVKYSAPYDNTDFYAFWRKEMTEVFVKRALESLNEPEILKEL
jgi:4-hydroxybenzoyl-CoA reductase subunit beta